MNIAAEHVLEKKRTLNRAKQTERSKETVLFNVQTQRNYL